MVEGAEIAFALYNDAGLLALQLDGFLKYKDETSTSSLLAKQVAIKCITLEGGKKSKILNKA